MKSLMISSTEKVVSCKGRIDFAFFLLALAVFLEKNYNWSEKWKKGFQASLDAIRGL